MNERHRDLPDVMWSLMAVALSDLAILVASTSGEAAASGLASSHPLMFYDDDAPIAT